MAGNPTFQRAGNGSPRVLIPPHAQTALLQEPGDSGLAVLLCLPGRTLKSTDHEKSLKIMLLSSLGQQA